MKKYCVMLMGEFDPEKDRAFFTREDLQTQIYCARNFREAKQKVRELQEEGYGSVELCGAFSREMALELMEITGHKMAIAYMVHEPILDDAFDSFFGKVDYS